MSYLFLLGKREHFPEAQDRLWQYCYPMTVVEERRFDTPMLEYTFGDDFPKTIYVLDATTEELNDFFGHVLRNVY